MKIVTVVSYPRTGSTLLIRHARHCGITSLLEIFHPNELVARKHIEGDGAIPALQDLASDYSRSAVLADFPSFLAKLRGSAISDLLVFKVFPGHLPERELQYLISESEAVVFHTRNRLHSFISNCFAEGLQSWGGNDTSDMLATFDSKEFLKYLHQLDLFLSKAHRMAIEERKMFLFSSYEDFLRCDSPDTQQNLAARLFSSAAGSRLEPKSEPSELPRKQDLRTDAFSKVANKEALREFLLSNCLNEIANGATDVSHFRYSNAVRASKVP